MKTSSASLAEKKRWVSRTSWKKIMRSFSLKNAVDVRSCWSASETERCSVEINQFESLNGAGERVKSFSSSIEISWKAVTSPQTERNAFDTHCCQLNPFSKKFRHVLQRRVWAATSAFLELAKEAEREMKSRRVECWWTSARGPETISRLTLHNDRRSRRFREAVAVTNKTRRTMFRGLC